MREDAARGVGAVGGAMGAGAGVDSEVDAGVVPSRTEGSEGGGPSIAHLRDSYFERMKDSILLFVVLEKVKRIIAWMRTY